MRKITFSFLSLYVANKYATMHPMNRAAKTHFDVIVVGGGAAGMMAAGRAAELGARVILLEKNDSLGKKLLITGGGRCNLTNAEFDTRKFLSKFGKDGKFLFSAFSRFGVKETIDFFNSKNMETKVEAENRVFPKSDSSKSVWDVLVKYMKSGGVTIFFNSPVDGFIKKDGKIESVLLKDGREIKARSFILATGGMSRPETGSTGEGLDWLSRIGHTVVKQGSALVPISVKDAWVKRLQGISLPNVKISIVQNGKKQVTQAGPLRRSQAQAGKILFTHYGLSGPAILNLSRDIGESLKYGDTHLSLDVLPNFDYAQLDSRLKEILKSESNKKFKNSLGKLLPAALSPVMVEISGINPEVFCRSVKRDERIAFGKLLKNIPLEVKGLLGADKAIVTSGGVALTEIDFKTMSSRFFPNLYLVGDILNINRPSGGYSLQLCWTTGRVAGEAAGKISKQ